jgi:crotonobetainyl-CoA:carnitine CoA-transferase CaiB-like acyl-CoA transferase
VGKGGADPAAGLPLAGLKVLDLSRVLAGPMGTMVLADLGAEVVKVEAPGRGDETRTWGPPFVDGESTYFLAINRGKRGVVLDLTQEEDRALARRLATRWADVVVENFRPGGAARLGLDPDGIMEESPRIIWATLRGYPPPDDRPGYDFVIQAGSGMMAITGPDAGPPYKVGVAVADMLSGLYLTTAILAAVVRRDREGRGARVMVSLAEAATASLINVAQSALMTGRPPARHGNAHPQLAPYEVLQAADGPIAVGVGNDRQFRAMADAVGAASLAEDPRFRENRGRVVHRPALVEELNRRLGERTVAEWCSILAGAGVPVDAVRSVPEALALAAARGQVGEVAHATVGPLPMVKSPIWLDGERLPLTTAPPVLGQDNDEVRRLGVGAGDPSPGKTGGRC